MSGEWRVDGAKRDEASITADWKRTPFRIIDGVSVREIANVLKLDGHLVEVFRRSWFPDAAPIDQVFQVTLNPGAISAWHAHESTTDHLFISAGTVRVVLFDNREDSPTRGEINEFRFGAIRPAVIVVPPRIWHGLQCVSTSAATILNLVDKAYDYEDPDHWRVPPDSAAIPFRF